MVAFTQFSFQAAYHQFYIAAGNDIKYSKAHEITHAGCGRFDQLMNVKANQRKSLRLRVVTWAFLFNPTRRDLHWHLRYPHCSCLRWCKLYVHIFGWCQDPVSISSKSSKRKCSEILHGLNGSSSEASRIFNFGFHTTEILCQFF